jgi:hypothetical protein
MTTSYDKTLVSPGSIELGYEIQGGAGTPEGLVVPSCTIEDVDRSVFTLFKEQLPLFYTRKKKQERVPVIFATGERFALLTRKKPLRDDAGAIILPLVSITRTGLDQGNTGLGAGQTQPIKIKRRLSEEDPRYQAFLNPQGLQNADDVAAPGRSSPGPGQVGTRRKTVVTGKPGLGGGVDQRHVYEVITVAPTRFFKATYEITIWCNYTQQLNSLISVIMQGYQNKHGRTFRLETPKGYWFVGKVGESFSPGNNFDGFSDDERLVRTSITMEVPGYTIEAGADGQPSGIRSFVSAPEVSFEMLDFPDGLLTPVRVGAPIGNPDALVLQDMSTLEDPLPGSAIGGGSAETKLDVRGDLQRRPTGNETTSVGGTSAGSDGTTVAVTATGERVLIKSRDVRKGETVLRTYGDLSLGDLFG